MEVVGTVAAALTFGSVILKLSNKLYKSAKNIRYARPEIMKLAKEMAIFSDLYEDFYRVCVSDQRKKVRNTCSTKRLIDWIKDAKNALRLLLHQVEALAGDSRYSKRETLSAHLKWIFSENEVKYLRCSLVVARQYMRAFWSLKMIDAINEEIQLIRDVMAQGDRWAIQELEHQLGVTLEERYKELNKTRRNRRDLKHAIELSIEDAADELDEQSKKISATSKTLESKQLFEVDIDVRKYAVQVRQQRYADTTSSILSRRQPARADSSQATSSVAARTFVSKPSSYSEPVAGPSPATSVEELDKASNTCGRCAGVCMCTETEPHTTVPVRLASPDSTPPSLPALFEHTSHRFDRSWEQTARGSVVHQATTETHPPSHSEPSTQEVMETHSSQALGHEADESEEVEEVHEVSGVDEVSEDEPQMSPFQPVAGVQGKSPRNWRNRHERRDSGDDHWHKRL